MARLRLALAQTNPVVGDLEGNTRQLFAAAQQASAQGADMLISGEMAISGYPIEDLASRPSFLAEASEAVTTLARMLDEAGLGELVVVVGHPDRPHEPSLFGASTTATARNAASVLHHGKLKATYAKHHLPANSVFDEYRNFIPGHELLIVRINNIDTAISIGEDLRADSDSVAQLQEERVGLVVVLHGSPFERDNDNARLSLVKRRAIETEATVAYVNLVGGQDDLVFDGGSVVVDDTGAIVARAPQFAEHLLVVDVAPNEATEASPTTDLHRIELGASRREFAMPLSPDIAQLPDDREQLWNALVLGLRDYVRKNGFHSVVLGLSGGIDSAVCAVLAADAIGAQSVYGVAMPSRYSSDHSRSDAADLAQRIGLDYSTQPIADLVAPFEQQLGFEGLAAENLQARIRGVILMGLSNQQGHLVLTTGNKTEIAIGYSTIYGDSVGGFAPIKDVPKLLVWELARWRNEHAAALGEVPPIPENSITKPPSAELSPGQIDQDSLPPYEVLDAILEAYVTRKLGARDIVALGFDPAVVHKITHLVDRAEWKRRQGAIGPKTSSMAFGRDRRLPVTYRPTTTQ